MTSEPLDDQPTVDDAPIQGALRETLVSALQRVPELAGRDLVLTPLSGGITNRNFRVDADGGLAAAGGAGLTCVMRMGGNDTHLLGISREVEHAATVAAAGVGVGPEVIDYIRPEGYLVTRFIVGTGISDEAVHDPATIRRVADSIRRIHGGPAIPGIFAPFRIGEAYRALALERGVPIPINYEAAHERMRRIEIAFLRAPVELRPCHNDLLNANFIDDGRRIRIVDWEYAGMGDPFFDLGNFSVNHGLDVGRGRHPARGLRGRSAAREARQAAPDARRLGLPRGDVGCVAAGDQLARRRLRGLCRAPPRSAHLERSRGTLRGRPGHARVGLSGPARAPP